MPSSPAAPSTVRPLDTAAFRFRPLRTLGFAGVVAVAFTLLSYALTSANPSWATAGGWLHAFAISVVVSLCISFSINLLYLGLRRLASAPIGAWPAWLRVAYFWGTPMAGVVIGLLAANLIIGAGFPDSGQGPELRFTPLGALVFMALVTGLFYGYFAIRRGQMRAEQRATEARLRLLQAQMEPHFLFNTLANVVGLIEADTPRAKAMLESFTDYLRASLGSLRASEHRLEAELALAEAYLRIAQIRMDRRLSYRIDVADIALREVVIPSLTLQPLVENAVLHGLEPTIDGGTVAIDVRRDADGRLAISVTDDGRGLDRDGAPPRGHGSALANIRERLAQRHGRHGTLTLEPVPPHGVRATLRLPA